MSVQVIEREVVQGEAAPTKQAEIAVFAAPRLPYHDAFKERFGIERMQWKALIEACYPNAKTIDAVAMVLSYCKARNLDPFKRPVHIVPMWSSTVLVPDPDNEGGTKRGGYVDTIWPSIAELRTTAFRTGQYAGKDETAFGPMIERTFEGEISYWENRRKISKQVSITARFPEWAQITLYRMVQGVRCAFVGPKVYWVESYATQGRTDLPNEMWQSRSIGQLDKCAEAAALRCTFPEEIGNQYAAEEMEGRRMIVDPSEAARDVTPTTAGPRKAPPPPAAEQQQQVVESPTTAPEPEQPKAAAAVTAQAAETKQEQTVTAEAQTPRRAPPPPAAQQQKVAPPPQEDDPMHIPANLRRSIPDAGKDPDTFLRWANDKFAAITPEMAEALGTVWIEGIEPHAHNLPKDRRAELDTLYRQHEARLAP